MGSRKLRVLQLIPTLDRSGAEKQMALLAAGLPRDRFESSVAALTRGGPLRAELEAAGVPVTVIGKRHKVDPFCLRKLIRFLRRGRFDVAQTWIFAANAYGRAAARAAGVPIVVTAEMAVDLWKSPRELAVDRFLARWTDRVVGNSEAVTAFYRNAGIPDAKLATIPSGIDVEAETAGIDRAAERARARAEFGMAPDAPLVVFVGRLAEQKGVDVLAKAMDLLQHGRPDIRTLVIGDGPSRESLLELARGMDLVGSGRMIFAGHREDARRLIAGADVLALPSRYEGLPNVVLEAMALGVPVVATDAPGTTELVIDGRTGLSTPRDEPIAFARAVRKLLERPELGAELADRARSMLRERFDLRTMIDRFAELYESLARDRDRDRERERRRRREPSEARAGV